MQRPRANQLFAYALSLTLVGSLFSIVLPASQQSFASHENITVNISGDEVTQTYEPDDTVAVEGVIDDVVEGEDVTVRFLEPSGGIEESEDAGEPGTNGNFDAVFDVPSGAEEGVWTVEVDYDNEEAYTYFIVDDEGDTIDVELDQSDGIYEPGDDVTILGQVDDPDASEEFVRIIVLDPANGEVVDEDEVELDGDEFEYEFTLDDEASHGRYAVIVTYDFDDQAGSTLFEILDEESGSDEEVEIVTNDTDGDLSAEIDDDVYDVGETVTVSGTIQDYDDTEELSITINDPDDNELEEEDDVAVQEDGSDGDFEFEYDLDDNAPDGAYTVIVAYDTFEVTLVFEVEEGSSGLGTEDITVELNKASYLAGETMVVSGTVEKLETDDDGEPELVSILLYRPDGVVVLSASKYVEPSSNLAYSANILIPSSLEVEEGYRIVASYDRESVEVLFDITGVSQTPSDKITVETDDDEYSVGSAVEISGEVPDALIVSDQQMLIRVDAPDGNPCRIDLVDVPSSGSFTYELVLGGKCGLAGEYDVEVKYGEEEDSTSFLLIGSSVSTYSLVVEGDPYPIQYELSAGRIDGMFVRPADDKLVITLSAPSDGQLNVELPRSVIDAIEDGQDIDYIVTIEDSSGNVITVNAEEAENTDDARMLVIDYPAGAERIEIAGTQVVPEFGAVAAIIMAIAILGIILATAKYNKLSLFRQ